MKRARAVLYWAGLPIGGKCKYLLAPETCLLHRCTGKFLAQANMVK